jgi:hypothetical protein
VPRPSRRVLRIRQFLGGELADCLEHPVAAVAVADEALVDERGERFEIAVTDFLGGLQRETAREDPKPREEALFARRSSS